MNALLPILLALAAERGPPTVGVLSLRADVGLPAGAATILTDLVAQRLRDVKVFAQVTAFREVEDTLTYEQQRQLSNCDNTGCLAEIAGAAGVDFIVAGNMGKLGNLIVVTLRMVDAHTGTAAASVSQTLEGGTDELVRTIPVLTDRLVADAGLVTRQQLASVADTSAPPSRKGPLYAGLGLLGAGVPSLLAGVVLAGAAVAVVVLPVLVAVPSPFTLDTKKRVLLGTGGTLGAVATVAAIAGLGLLAGGVAEVGAWAL